MDRKLAVYQNEQATATRSLEFLDNYGKSIAAKDVGVSKMAEYIEMYQKERTKLNSHYQLSTISITELEKNRTEVSQRKDRLQKAYEAARSAALKPIHKAEQKKAKARALKREQKRRVQMEKRKFWPFNVGQVILNLDGFGDGSPSHSRRNSTASQKGTEKPSTPTEGSTGTITLFLSYVTTKATWTPRYELNLKTPTSSGKIVYRAEYHNYSSETWKDANIVLSTSQTSFSGINEVIPNIIPWNVKLHKQENNTVGNDAMDNWKGGLNNQLEAQARKSHKMPLSKGARALSVSFEVFICVPPSFRFSQGLDLLHQMILTIYIYIRISGLSDAANVARTAKQTACLSCKTRTSSFEGVWRQHQK